MPLSFNTHQEVRELVAGFRRAQHAMQREPHHDSVRLRPVPLFTPKELAVVALFSALLSIVAIII